MFKRFLLVGLVALFGAVWAEDFFVGAKIKEIGDLGYLLTVRPCAPDYKNTYEVQIGGLGTVATFVVKKGDTFTIGSGIATKETTYSVGNISPNKITLVKQ